MVDSNKMSDFLRFTKINNFNDFIYATQESSEDFKRDLKQLDTGKTVIILLKLKTFEFEVNLNVKSFIFSSVS